MKNERYGRERESSFVARRTIQMLESMFELN